MAVIREIVTIFPDYAVLHPGYENLCHYHVPVALKSSTAARSADSISSL